jgi:hypothetical protein
MFVQKFVIGTTKKCGENKRKKLKSLDENPVSCLNYGEMQVITQGKIK